MRAQIDATKNLPNLEFEFTHMEGSSKYKPECYSLDSWIQYWADILETKKPTSFFCPSCQNTSNNIVGDHVKKVGTDEYFVTPIVIYRGEYVPLGKNSNEKFITGGTFSTDPSGYLAEGYQAVQSEDKWIVNKIQ